jgi:DNA-binding response OmpR family regulator
MARILIIEDDGDLQQILSLSLNQAGYEVHYAFTGKEGYDRILAVQPDLVLLDLMLPIMNGAEIVDLVRKNAAVRDVPIVIMTAHGDRHELLERLIKTDGVRGYLRKPFELAEIRSLVKRILAEHKREAPDGTQLVKGELRLDVKLRTVWISDRLVSTLSPTLADVMRVLMEAQGPGSPANTL